MTSTLPADAPPPSSPDEAPDLSLRGFARRLQQADVLDAPAAPGIDLSGVVASVQAAQAAAVAAAQAGAMPWDAPGAQGRGADGPPPGSAAAAGAAAAAAVGFGAAGAGVSTEPATGAARSGQLRSGLRWQAEDVVDVEPLPPSAIAAAVADHADHADDLDLDLSHTDGEADAATMRRAGAAAQRWQRDQTAQALQDWQPDLRAIGLRAALDPRVCTPWRPGAWIGAARTVVEASTELVNTPQGPLVDSRPALRLLVLWAPPDAAAPRPARWPQQLRLQPEDGRSTADQLLALLPATAELWLDPADADLDWALLAEIALHHDSGLRPAEREALRALIARERDRGWARLNDDYVSAGPGEAVQRRGAPD
ncbi:hypothetical protein [Pseudaquabacterium rugosum]|uniref:Uncharacterized protein n=1 Tax=Pseudaquabacterium rugosum TaxID=2984194 RepID=A0ABU9B8Y7_9BURK